MGSIPRFDSDRRELVRERRNARIERKRERRQARQLKRSSTEDLPPVPYAAQRLADEQVDAALDRIITGAADRHDEESAAGVGTVAADARSLPVAVEPVAVAAGAPAARPVAPAPIDREPRISRRDLDIAQFRERRQAVASEARREARARIARQGEPAAVADALGAIRDGGAEHWGRERELLERALASGKVAEVGAVARRVLWAASRDAARTSRRAGRDPELAAAVCVCYAIVAQLPRTAVRSQQRTDPGQRGLAARRRAFWR